MNSLMYLNTNEFFQNFRKILNFSFSKFYRGDSYVNVHLIIRNLHESNEILLRKHPEFVNFDPSKKNDRISNIRKILRNLHGLEK